MKCLKCYKKIPTDAVFCPYCGVSLRNEQEKEEDMPEFWIADFMCTSGKNKQRMTRRELIDIILASK